MQCSGGSPADHGSEVKAIDNSTGRLAWNGHRHTRAPGRATCINVTQVGGSARKRSAQPTLKRVAMEPKIDLHCEPGVLDCIVQIASTSELDAAADSTQSGAAAELERAICFHGAVDRPGERRQARQYHLAIDEPEVERGVVGNDKLMGC